MSIVFRNVKGSALTYTEMDRNQAQFFYSASVNANNLELHYTGSSILNTEGQLDFIPRSVTIPLGSGGSSLSLTQGTGISITNNAQGQTVITNTGTATPGAPITSIQFNDEGSFGGDNLFVYDKTNDRVGIGITTGMTRRLHIKDTNTGGAIVRLESSLTSGANKLAFLEIGEGSDILTQIGKISSLSDNTYIHQILDIQRTHFSFGSPFSGITATITNVGVGIGTPSPARNLSILGESNKGIGISAGNGRGVENRIRILPDDVWTKTFTDTNTNPLTSITKYGLGIHTPVSLGSEGGNMIIAVSDTGEGISESKSPNRLLITSYNVEESDDSLQGTPVHIASFTAAGRVGIHTPDPNQDIRLDINGQYRGAYQETSTVEKLDFKNYSVINFTPRQGASPFTLTDTIIPPAGTKAVLIVGTNTVDYEVVLSADSNLITGNYLKVLKNKTATITFVSDGTNLIETSRTTNLS